MANESETIKQKLQLEIEFAQDSISKALEALKGLNQGVEDVSKNSEEGAKKASGLSSVISKDLGESLGKLKSGLGPLAEFMSVGGPIAAGVTTFILMDKAVADLERTMYKVNNSFVNFRMNALDISSIKDTILRSGLTDEEGSSLLMGLSRSSAFTDTSQLTKSTVFGAGASQVTGIGATDMASLISTLVKSGVVDKNNLTEDLPKTFAKLIESSAKAGMSIVQYTKSVDDLYKSSRDFNLSFEQSQDVVYNFRDELRKGIFTLQDVQKLSIGSGLSNQSKLFFAQQMGIDGGSPLEILTKFEEMITKRPDAIKDELVKMTRGMSGNQAEQQQLIRLLGQRLGLPVDNPRQAKALLGIDPTEQEKKADLEIQKMLEGEAKIRVKEFESMEALMKEANRQYQDQTGILTEVKNRLGNFLDDMASLFMGGDRERNESKELREFKKNSDEISRRTLGIDPDTGAQIMKPSQPGMQTVPLPSIIFNVQDHNRNNVETRKIPLKTGTGDLTCDVVMPKKP